MDLPIEAVFVVTTLLVIVLAAGSIGYQGGLLGKGQAAPEASGKPATPQTK